MHVVNGYCPMGCGPTLRFRGGNIYCANPHCEDRDFVTDKLLGDDETEHIVKFDDEGFTILHPLRERDRDGGLLDCEIHARLRSLGGAPVAPGRYRVTDHQPDAYSESYRPGSGGLDYERLGDADGT